MHVTEIRTGRFVGTPVRDQDFTALRSIHGDLRAVATVSIDGLPLAEDRTRTLIRESSIQALQHGLGLWVFRRKDQGEFIGYAGLRRTVVDGNRETELYYAVHPNFWRQNCGTEMARALVHFAFEQRAIGDIISFTLPTNLGSRGVMEKCGLRYERDVLHVGLPHVLYRLTRPPT